MAQRHLKLPKKLDLGDITVRDGLQALEHYFPAEDKVKLAEELILSGYKHVEVTNFGHPKFLPQFKDCDEVLIRLFQSERVGSMLKQNGGDVTVCAITINERAADRALAFHAKHGFGPDFILQMVSTDEAHHRVNSGMSLEEYWKMSERCIQKATEAGVKVCGTVSTIWGSPIQGTRITDLNIAVEFSKRYLDIGADYIEQADHDGSADPDRVFEYFSMILDPEVTGKWADPKYHLAHFHTSRGAGLANYLAALQAGVTRFETTLSGCGGQPANTVDGRFTGGTGGYYHFEHLYSGLVQTEDFVVMCAAMGIDTGIDIRKLLETGKFFRDHFLKMKPADRDALLSNVSETTGIEMAKLAALEESDATLPDLVAEAVRNKLPAAQAKARERGKDPSSSEQYLTGNMQALLHSLVNYLKWRAWGPSRSETLLSDVPPSPHLAHLLDD